MSQSHYVINHYYYLNLKTEREKEIKPDVAYVWMLLAWFFLEEERMWHWGDDETKFSPEVFCNIQVPHYVWNIVLPRTILLMSKSQKTATLISYKWGGQETSNCHGAFQWGQIKWRFSQKYKEVKMQTWKKSGQSKIREEYCHEK